MPLTFYWEAGFWGLPEICAPLESCDLGKVLQEALSRERLPAGRVRVWYSSSRLAFLLEGIADSQTENLVEVRGPKAAVAFDFNRLPTPAANGFAAAQGVELGDLVIREIEGEKFVFARKRQKGKGFFDILPGLMPKLLASIPWPIPRWAPGMLLPQPPAYISALVEERIPNLVVDGMTVGRETGLREGGAFKRLPVPHAAEFPRIMQSLGIGQLPSERVRLIESQFQNVVPQGTSVRRQKAILEKIGFENERPKVFTGECSLPGISVPQSLLVRALAESPTWFPVEEKNGNFQSLVVGVLDNRLPGNTELSLRMRSLKRRLQEMAQCWDQDCARPLKERVADLRLMPASGGNGTLYDEALRIARRTHGLADAACVAFPEGRIDQTIVYLACERTLQTTRRFPDRWLNLIPQIASLQELDLSVKEALKDLASSEFGQEAMSANPVGVFIQLGWFFDRIFHPLLGIPANRETGIYRFVDLLIDREVSLDLGKLASEPREERVSRDEWVEALKRRLSQENFDLEKQAWLWSRGGIDPFGILEAARKWPEGPGPEIAALDAIHKRISAKVHGMVLEILPPVVPAEVALHKRLEILEAMSAGRQKLFLERVWESRPEIEACLMDLPPVFDETRPEWKPRASLLLRVLRQLSRLPGLPENSSSFTSSVV